MSQFTPHHPALLRPYSKPANPDVIRIVRGKDALVFDDQGNQYIDGMGALWYCNIGHGRPEIGDAVAKQMSTLANYHCFEPFTSEPAEQLAERIKALAPVDNARVFLTSSGSEAVDSAMKLARISHVQAGRPERTLIVSRSRGYHGVTYGGLSAQGLPLNQAGFGPLLTDIINVPADDDEAMATVFVEHGEQIAAVITEPVQGAGGVYPPTDGYLATLRRLCDKHGAFLIFDEVICGFGRLGRWFGADYFGVRPDLMTFAKGVSSGYIPMGGVVVGAKVLAGLEADPGFLLRHGHTYSGHAAASVGAMVNIDIIDNEEMIARGAAMGARLGAGLRSLADDNIASHARGVGAVWALGLNDGVDSIDIRNKLYARGVISRALPGTMTFCPPFVTTDAQVDHIIDALADSLK